MPDDPRRLLCLLGLAAALASPASALSWTAIFENLTLDVDASASPPFTFLRDSDSDADSSDGWSISAASAVSAGSLDSAASANGEVIFSEPDTLTFTFHSGWTAGDTTGPGGPSVSYGVDLDLTYWFVVPQAGVLDVSWQIDSQGIIAGYDHVFGASWGGNQLAPGALPGSGSLALADQWTVAAGELVMLVVNAGPANGRAGIPAIQSSVDATFVLSYSPVPEPTSLVLAAAGLAGLALRRRR